MVKYVPSARLGNRFLSFLDIETALMAIKDNAKTVVPHIKEASVGNKPNVDINKPRMEDVSVFLQQTVEKSVIPTE